MTPHEILQLLDQDDVEHRGCPDKRAGDACFYWRAMLWSEWRTEAGWRLLLYSLGLSSDDR